jgi:hypothetical protein
MAEHSKAFIMLETLHQWCNITQLALTTVCEKVILYPLTLGLQPYKILSGSCKALKVSMKAKYSDSSCLLFWL